MDKYKVVDGYAGVGDKVYVWTKVMFNGDAYSALDYVEIIEVDEYNVRMLYVDPKKRESTMSTYVMLTPSLAERAWLDERKAVMQLRLSR
jgi:hypothetical protein